MVSPRSHAATLARSAGRRPAPISMHSVWNVITIPITSAAHFAADSNISAPVKRDEADIPAPS